MVEFPGLKRIEKGKYSAIPNAHKMLTQTYLCVYTH